MDFRILQGIVYNIALLLSLGLVYDSLVVRERFGSRILKDAVNGLVLSLIVTAVMLTPVRLGNGVVFDTRSVLLATAGLFFGWGATLPAVVTAGVLRFLDGGSGQYMGAAVIFFSGAIGVLWRRFRYAGLGRFRLKELILFSVIVHLVMLGCMLFLPEQAASKVFRRMGFIILLVYPAGMTLLLQLMQRRFVQGRLQERVRENEQLLREYFDNAPDGIFVADMHGRYVDVNRAAELISGYSRGELLGMSVMDLTHPGDHAKLERRFARVLDEGQVTTVLHYVRKDGSRRTWLVSASRLSDNRVLGFTRDITERLQAQDDLRASLEEKDLLLRELYHRTKNNMQVISSMLQLQAVVHQTPEVGEVVRNVSARIRTIALVHQKLYQSGDLSSLNLREYVDDLFFLMTESYGVEKGGLLIEKHIGELNILMDIAVPLGLVLNELFTNSLRYAFPDQDGKICLCIDRCDGGMIELDYRDNGPGLEPGFDPMSSSTLGLKTVVNIGKHQLGGEVEFSGENGFGCRLRFSERVYRRRV